MTHGTPDWGVTAGRERIYRLTDLGELAARLGSPITHDRRGDVIWWDDLEWSLNKWTTSLSGTGAAAAISAAYARNGQMSCLLTGGSDAFQRASISHYQAFMGAGRVGAEISMSIPNFVDYMQLRLETWDGTNYGIFTLRYNDTSGEIQYEDSGAGFPALETGVSLRTGAHLFHTFKVVADINNGRYVRAIVDASEYDLAGIGARWNPSATSPSLVMTALVGSRAASNDQVYVDDGILTINEPA